MSGSSRSETPASTASGPSTQRTSETLNEKQRASQKTASPKSEADSPVLNGSFRRRHRQQNVSSGGFFLDTLSAHVRSSPISRRYGSLKSRGKEAVKDQDATPQRHSTYEYGSMSNGGPISAREASPASSAGQQHRDSPEAPELPPRPSSQSPYMARSSPHTDPRQLVSLALQLSQNRQRQASARFQPHTAGAGAGAGASGRVVSIGSLAPVAPVAARQSQPDSGFASSVMGGVELMPGAVIANGTQKPETQGPEEYIDPDGPGAVEFFPSPQTLIRAERARIALELSYHHRRALQHLPKLPTQKSKRPGTSATSVSDDSSNTGLFGRAYNPLQYVRNRRIRRQKKMTLDPEKEGWGDLERVTAWVDEVSVQRNVHIMSVNDRYPLPPLRSQGSSQLLEASRATLDDSAQRRQPGQGSLPPNDWSMTPSALLADVFWLHEDDHRFIIEDHQRDRVFAKPAIKPDTMNPRKKSIFDSKRQTTSAAREGSGSEDNIHTTDLIKQTVLEEPSSMKSTPKTRKGSKVSSARKGSKASPFEARKHAATSSSSEDEALDRRTRPWSKTFSKHWEGITMPDKRQRDQAGKILNTEGFGRLSSDIQSSRDSKELTRPFSLDIERSEQARSQISTKQDLPTDTDTTAPNSPMQDIAVPSFATDFDPAAIFGSSPPQSATKPRKNISKLNEVDLHDFAEDPFQSNAVEEIPTRPLSKAYTTALSSPSEASFSADSDKRLGLQLRRQKTGRPTLKRNDSNNFRVPKPWKAGKFVVDQVGGLLRRKDYASDTSDTDGERRSAKLPRGSAVSSSAGPRANLSRSSTLSGAGESPAYRQPELPSFSPLRPPKGEPSPTKPRLATESISQRLSAHMDNTSLLSPTYFSLKSPSRSLTPQLSRMNSQDDRQTSSLPNSIQSPGNASDDSNSQEQQGDGSRRGATVVDTQGRQWPPVNRTNAAPWPGEEQNDDGNKSIWTGPELTPTSKDIVAKRDILRVDAVLRSAINKATFITERFGRVPEQDAKAISPIAREIRAKYKVNERLTSQVEEPVVLGRHIVTAIDRDLRALAEARRHFTESSVPRLADALDGVRTRVRDDLTGAVLASGDRADALGQRLAAEMTWEVKEISDALDAIFRRRRRRTRFLRRVAYALLERLIMAAMWAVWLLVVLFKTVRSTLYVALSFLRWLFLL